MLDSLSIQSPAELMLFRWLTVLSPVDFLKFLRFCKKHIPSARSPATQLHDSKLTLISTPVFINTALMFTFRFYLKVQIFHELEVVVKSTQRE